MRNLLLVPLLIAITATAAARADVITTFDVAGTFTVPSNGTFSGTLTIDTTAGVIESADILFPGPLEFNLMPASNGYPDVNVDVFDSDSDDLFLQIATADPGTLAGFTGGNIIYGNVIMGGNQRSGNSGNGNQRAGNGPLFDDLSGTITPAPEPSSFWLLAGAIGCLSFGLVRRLRILR